MSYYKIILVMIILVFLSPLLIPWPDKLEYRESDLLTTISILMLISNRLQGYQIIIALNIFLLMEVHGKQTLLFFTVVMWELFVII